MRDWRRDSCIDESKKGLGGENCVNCGKRKVFDDTIVCATENWLCNECYETYVLPYEEDMYDAGFDDGIQQIEEQPNKLSSLTQLTQESWNIRRKRGRQEEPKEVRKEDRKKGKVQRKEGACQKAIW